MISVEAALAEVLALAAPVPAETVALRTAAGRVLARPVRAGRDQPPFAASAMDGYALAAGDAPVGARYRVVGAAPAGRGWNGTLDPGTALRIFTGAPLPAGADRVAIQEDVTRDGDAIALTEPVAHHAHVRPQGTDFTTDFEMAAGRFLAAPDVALLAAMNLPEVSVRRRPVVALIATGDELVMPGEAPRADQIVASNTFALAAMVEAAGAEARMLPIARDTESSLRTVLGLAEGADLIVTIGGASVGDHDLVGDVTEAMGLQRAFYKIAMRPGKPLMAGRLGGAALLGLPGNPVSSIVCGHVFMLPMLRRMLRLAEVSVPEQRGRLTREMAANGPRAHYMRARLTHEDGGWAVDPFPDQDSSLLRVLSEADALMIRPPHDPAQPAGATVRLLPLR